ncbi:MAG: PEF-CTERM sorting domain-containing protein [Methanosarcina sp.]|uniref:PEF-CTERM sorting domain-containing protein n=1 Tax=Methanosarcina sp. TaxID=2213 RepID=UPI00261D7986|nr:PEF-CTERM sorting domain-containing protein [Methanosarcina sp.]MDD3245976.1 PEF-CTERM sorting domain-containing protein [Methanosarcina sp.]MDD4249032.1 PEF-CTERM sorting domain-containing protein [Methanosarcina sp.]
MKKILYALMIVACLLTLGVGNAMAYDTIDELLSDVYGPYTYKEVSQNSLFDYAPNNPHTMNIKYTRPYVTAEDMYTLGIYNPTGLVKTPYFGVGTDTDLDFNTEHRIDSLYTFGLYIDYYNGSSTTFYSCAINNNDGKHAKIYQILNSAGNPVDGKYVVAFDDGDETHVLNDFMDVVIEIHPVTAREIPEFPTVALPFAAILGLMFVFGRKKEE